MSGNEIKRCPACKRSKNKAIQEQRIIGEPCGISGCVFKNEIEEALMKKIVINVVKKEKVKIAVVKKEKSSIKINRK